MRRLKIMLMLGTALPVAMAGLAAPTQAEERAPMLLAQGAPTDLTPEELKLLEQQKQREQEQEQQAPVEEAPQAEVGAAEAPAEQAPAEQAPAAEAPPAPEPEPEQQEAAQPEPAPEPEPAPTQAREPEPQPEPQPQAQQEPAPEQAPAQQQAEQPQPTPAPAGDEAQRRERQRQEMQQRIQQQQAPDQQPQQTLQPQPQEQQATPQAQPAEQPRRQRPEGERRPDGDEARRREEQRRQMEQRVQQDGAAEQQPAQQPAQEQQTQQPAQQTQEQPRQAEEDRDGRRGDRARGDGDRDRDGRRWDRSRDGRGRDGDRREGRDWTRERGERMNREPRFEAPPDARRVEGNDNRVIFDLGSGEIVIQHDDTRRLRHRAEEVYYDRLPNGFIRTTIERPDGVRIVTVEDEYGNVIERRRILPGGREIVLVAPPRDYENRRGPGRRWRDPALDLPPITVTMPREQYILEAERADREAFVRTLQAPPVQKVEETYSLEDVRYSERLRDLMPRIDLDSINFDTGSYQITRSEIDKLSDLAYAMQDMLDGNPAETFLIEGHTDAIGSETSNLALSDRRAESVASALTEVYDIPPENLVTQGYGEEQLKIQTQQAERENRRVTVRRITPLVNPTAQAQ